MTLQIGMFVYLLVKSCSHGLGATAYPLDDKGPESRIIFVCTDYGANQTSEVFMHELVHACLHDHAHNFKTKKDLQDHVSKVDPQQEELFAANLAHCIIPALEDKDATKFLGLVESSNTGSCRGPFVLDRRKEATASECKLRGSRNSQRKINSMAKVMFLQRHSSRYKRREEIN